jgi:3-phenylpropionate/trans-cinnamate dioxygenase ferredoxin reductase component
MLGGPSGGAHQSGVGVAELNEIVVVGGSLGGLRAVEAIRREGFTGAVTLVGDEEHFPPYDRPPLSKEVLMGQWEPERARLRTEENLEVELVLGTRAERLDLERNEVILDDGTSRHFDGLVIATGAKPRTMSIIDPALRGVYLLRTVADSLALQAALAAAAKVVVIGGGWIGGEVAAACRSLDLDVTVIEALRAPMMRSLGPDLGMWAAELHRAHGVDVRLGVGVEAVLADGDQVAGVVLADGSEFACDVLVVAVGAAPVTDWVEGSGLLLNDGVVCAATGFALGTENIVAVGDVARWYNPLFNRELRVEHWSNAVEQADWAAKSLVHGAETAEPFSAVPYFWSDQYGKKIQYVGVAGEFAGVVEGALDAERFVAIFTSGEQLVGALCVNAAPRMIRYRRLIAGGVGPDAVASILPNT